MKIGKVNINGNIFLAPMAGVTDVGFRSVCREFGADLCYTEMVSAKGLIYGEEKTLKCFSSDISLSENDIFLKKNILNEQFIKDNIEISKNKTCTLLLTEENEVPKVVQLFGNDPEIMAKACQHPLVQKFDIIDINMGCPAPKIVKNGEGSKLMEDMELAGQIISACKNATDKPITVKFRKGFKKDVAVQFAKVCENAGASAITIHGRLATQMYGGEVDYQTIKAVKESVKIPVIGSGDIRDEKSYKKMLEIGVDAVMIGRGALGKPYIFDILKGKKIEDYNQIRLYCARKHVQILREYFKEEFLTKYMRKHFLWYASGTNQKELKQKLAVCEKLEEGLSILENILINE